MTRMMTKTPTVFWTIFCWTRIRCFDKEEEEEKPEDNSMRRLDCWLFAKVSWWMSNDIHRSDRTSASLACFEHQDIENRKDTAASLGQSDIHNTKYCREYVHHRTVFTTKEISIDTLTSSIRHFVNRLTYSPPQHLVAWTGKCLAGGTVTPEARVCACLWPGVCLGSSLYICAWHCWLSFPFRLQSTSSATPLQPRYNATQHQYI